MDDRKVASKLRFIDEQIRIANNECCHRLKYTWKVKAGGELVTFYVSKKIEDKEWRTFLTKRTSTIDLTVINDIIHSFSCRYLSDHSDIAMRYRLSGSKDFR